MQKIRGVLNLKCDPKLSNCQTGTRLKMTQVTVANYLKLAISVNYIRNRFQNRSIFTSTAIWCQQLHEWMNFDI